MGKNRRKHRYMAVLTEENNILSQPNTLITPTDISELKNYCLSSVQQFYDKWGEHNGYVFIPGNRGTDDKSKRVLAVGHLDCYTSPFYTSPNQEIVYSACLDDRLGVWAICRKLPSMLKNGRDYDILLTTGEEDGLSTASAFFDDVGTDKYNWVFELDRRGTDAVHYGYTEPDWLKVLQDDGWDMKRGSVSDIVEFEDGEVSGVNFGIGYTGEHTTACNVIVRQLEIQLTRIASFYTAYNRVKFPHYDTKAYDTKPYHLPLTSKYGPYGQWQPNANPKGTYSNVNGVWGYHDTVAPDNGISSPEYLGTKKVKGV